MLDDGKCRFLNSEIAALLGSWQERLKGRIGFDLLALSREQNKELEYLLWKHRREFALMAGERIEPVAHEATAVLFAVGGMKVP